MPKGIVSARHVDHVGLVVPDLQAAVQFFEEALGAQLLWRVGPLQKTPMDFPIKDVSLATLRLGPNLNVELQAFEAGKQNKTMPNNVDLGTSHIAFFVDDIKAAAQSLKEHGQNFFEGQFRPREMSKKARKSGISKHLGAPLWKYYGVLNGWATRRTLRIASSSHTISGRN